MTTHWINRLMYWLIFACNMIFVVLFTIRVMQYDDSLRMAILLLAFNSMFSCVAVELASRWRRP